MATDALEQSDSPTETPVVDPLDAGATNSQNGTAEALSTYEEEVEAMKRGEFTPENQDEEREESAEVEESEEEEADADAANSAEQQEEEEEEEEAPKASNRFRFKNADDQAVAAIAKAKGCSLVEAARIYAGDPAKPAETQEQVEVVPVETSDAIEAQIEELLERKLEAIRAIDVETQAELEKEIRGLEKKARALAIEEERAKAHTDATANEQQADEFNKNWEKALAHYPELSDPNSRMYKEMQKIDAQMRDLGDPIYDLADKPWTVALKAAKATGTLMSKPKNESPTAPKKGNQGSPVKPASGSARTTSADPNQKFVQEIEGLETLDDYEEQVRKLKGEAA